MIDEARKQGIGIRTELLRIRLGAAAVIPTSAKYGEGIQQLTETILDIQNKSNFEITKPRLLEIEHFLEPMQPVIDLLENHKEQLCHHPLIDSLRLISEHNYIHYLLPYLEPYVIRQLQELITAVRKEYNSRNIPYQALESASRYAFIDVFLAKTIIQQEREQRSVSEKIDGVLTHRFWGPLVLLGVLAFIFHAIFSWSQYPMIYIGKGFEWLSVVVSAALPSGPVKSLISEGIIPGVGNILVFLPQIVLLVFFLSLLEDSGYMARMAFMMDRLMHKIGLHGRSVLPLLSGFACAIPAIMAARTIESRRDRLITIMIIPLMSCSARLPMYILLIAAFVPPLSLFGIISLQGLALMGMYLLGVLMAIVVAIILKKLFPFRESSELIMELPPYRKPLLVSVWWQVYDRAKSFVTTAGSIILAVSIVLWFLASYPKPDAGEKQTAKNNLENSYAGRIGHFLEPAIEPLGYDWKIGVGLVSSFAAREMIISAMSTLYNIQEESDENVSLIYAIKTDRYPDGRKVFTPLTVLSLLVFFAFAGQCMATFAIVKKETNSWRWPIVMVTYLTVLAYLSALLVYQAGIFLGFS
jgi:ferrous iron transport protein B